MTEVSNDGPTAGTGAAAGLMDNDRTTSGGDALGTVEERDAAVAYATEGDQPAVTDTTGDAVDGEQQVGVVEGAGEGDQADTDTAAIEARLDAALDKEAAARAADNAELVMDPDNSIVVLKGERDALTSALAEAQVNLSGAGVKLTVLTASLELLTRKHESLLAEHGALLLQQPHLHSAIDDLRGDVRYYSTEQKKERERAEALSVIATALLGMISSGDDAPNQHQVETLFGVVCDLKGWDAQGCKSTLKGLHAPAADVAEKLRTLKEQAEARVAKANEAAMAGGPSSQLLRAIIMFRTARGA